MTTRLHRRGGTFTVRDDIRNEWIELRQKLKQERLNQGLSQKELGVLMDRTPDYVRHLENGGSKNPGIFRVLLWMKALDTKLTLSDRDEE
jgi:transcriptional regulator with XRE-family HTH domain